MDFGNQQQSAPRPSSYNYIPESTVELDAQMLQVSGIVFKNAKIQKLLSNDTVRSYLNDHEIKALYHLASAYQGLVDASQDKYDGIFDNAAEMVLSDFLFLINIARSRQGINIRVMKGREPLQELKKETYSDRFKPPFPNREPESNNRNQSYIPEEMGHYNYR